jgi:4-hydroxybenzoate polyprenyltransferase
MKKYLSLVTFTHTIFAMPFAFIGFFLAVTTTDHKFEWQKLVMMLLCMVFARNSAMAFNRYLDRNIDAKNPRTKQRDIPAGRISPAAALTFTLTNCGLFILTTWFINPLCFYLSPIALLVVLGYSATKRFTALCHMVLGLGLSLAPIGAYLVVTGAFALTPVFFSLSVLCWVSGFDIIYALQDEDFDRNENLHSIPAWLGKVNALRLIYFAACFFGSIYCDAGVLHQRGPIVLYRYCLLLCHAYLPAPAGKTKRSEPRKHRLHDHQRYRQRGIRGLLFDG